jgi:hypothetical protein
MKEQDIPVYRANGEVDVERSEHHVGEDYMYEDWGESVAFGYSCVVRKCSWATDSRT